MHRRAMLLFNSFLNESGIVVVKVWDYRGFLPPAPYWPNTHCPKNN